MFNNRISAGEILSDKLISFKNQKEVFVVGLPRGGVVTAWAIAKKLNLPLFALPVKKVKHPHQVELAIGAVGPDNTIYINKDLLRSLSLTSQDLAKAVEFSEAEQKKAENKFFQKEISWSEKVVILVDDGVATGATCECAIRYFRKQKVSRVVLAVPVIAPDTFQSLRDKFDDIITLKMPTDFQAVGQYYKEFEQVRDEEVKRYLEMCNIQRVTQDKD